MRKQNYLRETAVFSISLYQRLISPYLPPSCRFHPSCSEYAKQATMKYGLRRGLWRSLGRILRCNPWGMGGYDPVR